MSLNSEFLIALRVLRIPSSTEDGKILKFVIIFLQLSSEYLGLVAKVGYSSVEMALIMSGVDKL